jgi:hypothetical protein
MEVDMNYRDYLKAKAKYDVLLEAANDLRLKDFGIVDRETDIKLRVISFDSHGRPVERPYIVIDGPHISDHRYSFEEARVLKKLLNHFLSEEKQAET